MTDTGHPLHVQRRWYHWFVGCWIVGVAFALVVTLWSLEHQGFDGLNNMFQIPFALPWVLLPMWVGSSTVAFAWIAAGGGVFNGALIFMWARRESELAAAQRTLAERSQPR